MNIFFEIHKDLPREGPGDRLSTLRALALMKDLPANPLFLDIGCGPGKQTLDLAQGTAGKITAIDNHPPFLDQLRARVRMQGLSERIRVMNGSMFALPFPASSFEVVWCEGAIYIIGFQDGLKTWRHLLRPGGYLAVTEISWLRPDPPAALVSYWLAEYPGMHSMQQNLTILQAAGYREVGSFSLPRESWWAEYYDPIEAKLPGLREKYRDTPQAIDCIDSTQKEIELYRKYADWYGYVFYVAQVCEDG